MTAQPVPPFAGDPSPASQSQEQDAQAQDFEVHDFEVQKQLHQKIRNDPDYDDWEYGTEPLPHEAWVAKQAAPNQPPPAST